MDFTLAKDKRSYADSPSGVFDCVIHFVPYLGGGTFLAKRLQGSCYYSFGIFSYTLHSPIVQFAGFLYCKALST